MYAVAGVQSVNLCSTECVVAFQQVICNFVPVDRKKLGNFLYTFSEDIHTDEDSAQEGHSKADHIDDCTDQLFFVCKCGDKECQA